MGHRTWLRPRSLAAAAVFLLVAVSGLSADLADASAPLRLSPLGVGPVRFGMSAAQAGSTLHARVKVSRGVSGCSFWTVSGFAAQRGQLIAFGGRLSYAIIYGRGPSTTRRTRVGDTIAQLRHRYRHLRHGKSGSLGAADERLFADQRSAGRTYTIEFDIVRGKVAFISAGSRRTIETFGECA